MGNICRSPTAEAVFRDLVRQEGLEDSVVVASAGTHGYHIRRAPDRRAQRAAASRGFDMSAQRAQQVSAALLGADYVLVMDEANRLELQRTFPEVGAEKLMVYAPAEARARYGDEVPDPYYGGDEGFEAVLDMLEAAATGLLRDIRTRLG